MMKYQIIVFTIAVGNVAPAIAHECRDGSRVKCMAVTAKSMLNAPRAVGGYSATGSPFCTPDGKKVYCLKDHSYHRCADGEEPCCQDGSNPSHNGASEGDSSNYQCSASSEETTAQTPVQIVLDDMEHKSESLMQNAFEGSYAPCMVDAWNGQFHHDWARNKGEASYSFKVNVPVSGCYKLEEYHPGGQYTCSRYLPRNARLDVKYGEGKSTTLYVNQAVDGAKWNMVASFEFQKGIEGELLMRNHNAEQCAMSTCFWVVDAFRLTRTSEHCGESDPEPEPEPKKVPGLPATTNEGDPQPELEPKKVLGLSATTNEGRSGSLLLQASWSGLGSVQLEIEEHKSIVETVLAAHLGHTSVEVLSISKQGRRLHGQGEHAEHLKIDFVARDEIVGSSSQKSLRQALQEAFDQKAVGITFHSAIVSWASPSAPEDVRSCTILYVIVAAVVGIALLSGLGLFICRHRAKRDVAGDASAQKNVMHEEDARMTKNFINLESTSDEKKEVNEEKDVDGKEIDCEVLSISTGTPCSDDENSEGSNITPSNSLQQESEIVVAGHVIQDL